MGKPGDPTARVMITPVPAHLTTDDDQLTDAAGIGVGRSGAKAVLAVPGAGALLSASVIARLPLAMLSLALLVHAEHLTGSFALAGLVSGGYTVGLGVGGPFLGRLVDRRGQLVVLLATAFATSVLLAAVALLPASAPGLVLVAVAAGIGLTMPPVSGCVRTLLPEVLPDAEALPAAYALESSALELTFIFGPPLALGLAAFSSTRAALASACGRAPAARRLVAVTSDTHAGRRLDRRRRALRRDRGRCHRRRHTARQYQFGRVSACAWGPWIAGRRRCGDTARRWCPRR